MSRRPSDIASLRLWLMPETVYDVPHDSVLSSAGVAGKWADMSGFRNDFDQATAGQRPLVLHDQLHRRPVVEFDPASNHRLDGPSMTNVIQVGQGTFLVAFYPTDVTTTRRLLTTSTTRMKLEINGATSRLRAHNLSSGANVVSATSVPPILVNTWNIGIWSHRAGRLYVGLNDPLILNSTASGNTSSGSGVMELGATATDTEQFVGFIGGVLGFNTGLLESDLSAMFAYLAADVRSRGRPLEIIRDVGSRRSVYVTPPRLKVQVGEGLIALDEELLDTVAWSHEYMPHPIGEGQGLEVWRRRPLLKIEEDEDIDALAVSVTYMDRLSTAHVYRDTAIPLKSADSRREGVAISGLGAARMFTRLSAAYVENPGGSLVVKVPSGLEKVARDGWLLEGFTQQVYPRAAFISGLTGLTRTGHGVNGSDIAALTTPVARVWSPTVSTNVIKLTAGSPHTADLHFRPSSDYTLGINNNTVEVLSIDHLDLDGTALEWRLQRSGDNFYFNDSSGAWQSGSVWNALPITASATVPERHRSKLIPVTALGGVTAKLEIGMQSGGTSGRRHEVYHVQHETTRWPTSRIPSNGSNLAREADFLTFSNHASFPFFPLDHGTFKLRIRTQWNYDDHVAGAQLFVAYLNHWQSWTQFAFYFEARHAEGAFPDRWVIRYEDGTNTNIAYFAHQPVAGVEYALAFRWTGAAGELGLPDGEPVARTMDVFVDGVKGVHGTMDSTPAQQTYQYLSSGVISAFVTDVSLRPVVETNEEIAAWAAS